MFRIHSVSLRSFRCYNFCTFEFDIVNGVIGPNGSGKTSILEAISMLNGSSGFRGVDLSLLKSSGSSGFEVGFTTNIGDIVLQCVENTRTFTLDGDSIKASKLAQKFNVVYVNTYDELTFASGKVEMRSFLDRLTSHFFTEHGKNILQLKTLASERLKLLEINGDSVWILAIEKQMAQLLCAIAYNRVSVLARLNSGLKERGVDIVLRSIGRPEVVLESGKSFSELESLLVSQFLQNRPEDKRLHKTSGGISGDFEVSYCGKSIDICSAGEQKFVVIMLAIVCTGALSGNRVLLIDDFHSKFDSAKQAALMNEVLHLNVQVFISSITQIDSIKTIHLS
jgi:DNA replication and repair protein RecF